MARLFDVVGKIGEGTYGVVYLARSRAPQPCLLAVKTFKPGKVLARRAVCERHYCKRVLLQPSGVQLPDR